jgi:hydrogenase/urease accessory protein HupE
VVGVRRLPGLLLFLAAFVAAFLAACTAQAHEVRPAFLKLDEVAPNTFEVIWKQPVLGDRRLPIDPTLPEDCTRTQSAAPQVSNGALLHRWTSHCDLRSGRIAIRGLQQTLTDTMVQLNYLNGDRVTGLLRAAAPYLDLANPTPSIWSYGVLGVEHLLSGADHILFVVGLVLLIGKRWTLLQTITAFTLAHSITLAVSVLGLIVLPQAPVEAVIALSILFLARELVLAENHRSAITRSKPWLMAFAFGLLHGFGFAGALAEIGLPQEQLAATLLLFNIGIEIGQLVVICTLLSVAWLLSSIRHMPTRWYPLARKGYASAMGVAAAFWTIDRVVLIF